jgi:hypothetical protein
MATPSPWKTQRLGAEVVLADGLQHAPEGRVHDVQQHQEQHPHHPEDQPAGTAWRRARLSYSHEGIEAAVTELLNAI